MLNKKKVVFLTGTRADFGKLKSLIEVLLPHETFDVHIFATGMHMDEKYGYTVHEIEKCGYPNIYKYINHYTEQLPDITLGTTIQGFSNFVRLIKPDLIIVHGDRPEALAGASVGALNNILVAHIEGGELSGTVDELIRHAVSKLSHVHFVANEEAKERLLQMGETRQSIYVIGSPDMDVILSDRLPGIEDVKSYYGIEFGTYAISLFHPVTTEIDMLAGYASAYFEALENSGLNYIVVNPNNDIGSEIIMQHVRKCADRQQYKVYPSIRFESFLTLLKHADFIIGNSSAGIREAPYYGLSVVNVGTRQKNRTSNSDIINTGYITHEIETGIREALNKRNEPRFLFGTGCSDFKFLEILQQNAFWEISRQKQFADSRQEI
ncbi:UDP-N-acetylglucosamine 2-epimerase [Foetidibacter luteolus]|uniref:UDP-N-acetylglucosamine 2-epimerase n=1 Tax=Foetidibacter luteolus TaxID=2608880 RepID=UPI00129A4510|nr:UDP-N-acetylglucosamine 2-epimerase [Foetidibacter luteolus]